MKQIDLTKVVFTTIDKVFEFRQNPRKMERELKDVSCVKDIVYSEKYPEMALDLYFLPAEGKRPVIFEIHGGGFSAGDKKYRRCLCRYFAKNTGAIVVNANYGVGKECACPVPMQQLVEAVNWVADNAEKYNMDLSKFVVTGDSAGAFYSCFLATLQDSEFMQELFHCKMKAKFTATVLNCGLYDMKHALKNKMALNNGVCKELTGMEIEEAKNSKYFKGLNLVSYVTEKFPPTMLIYSQSDIFCKGQGESMLSKLKKCKVPTQCICATSVIDNHTYSLMWITSTAKQTNEKILEFLNEHFGGDDNSSVSVTTFA